MIDGVIKYHFEFHPSEVLDPSLWGDIEAVRGRLFALGLIGVTEDGIGFGNISQRKGGDSFVITGTQTGDRPLLSAEHYALVEEYDDREFYLKSSGKIKPSSEALTHGTLYRLSPKIGAVIHVHSLALWAFMLKENYLKTEKVEYGSIEMIDEVNRIFSSLDPLTHPKFVMAGHEEGIMVFGENLQKAEFTLYALIAALMQKLSL